MAGRRRAAAPRLRLAALALLLAAAAPVAAAFGAFGQGGKPAAAAAGGAHGAHGGGGAHSHYWWNRATGATQWEEPVYELRAEDGAPYFVDPEKPDAEPAWERPASLAWEEVPHESPGEGEEPV
jgi:hypothetical protein